MENENGNGEEVRLGWGSWRIALAGRNILVIVTLIIALGLLFASNFLEHKDDREDHNRIIAQQDMIIKNQQELISQHAAELSRLDRQREVLEKYYGWIVDQYEAHRR